MLVDMWKDAGRSVGTIKYVQVVGGSAAVPYLWRRVILYEVGGLDQ